MINQPTWILKALIVLVWVISYGMAISMGNAQETPNATSESVDVTATPSDDVSDQGTGTDILSLTRGALNPTPATTAPSEEPRNVVNESDAPPVSRPPAPDKTELPEVPANERVITAEDDAIVPQPSEPETGTTDLSETPAPSTTRDLLLNLWRTDVLDGKTNLGFESWLMTSLDLSTVTPAPAMDSTPPAESTTTTNTTETTAVSVSAPETHDDRTRQASERWLARAGPVALGEAGRVVTVFGSAIPTAFCSPLTVCTIELEPGEVLTDTPSWGDAVRWQVVAKKQGVDTVLLEIKPADDAQITNLVIPTNRRLYTVKLVNDAEVHTPILAFHYPDTIARNIQAALEQDEADAAASAAVEAAAAMALESRREAELARSGIDTEKGRLPASELDFAFRVDGRAPFRPVRVFADGDRTYIDLPPSYRGAMPAIVAGPDEQNAALNTRVGENGTRLIADRVISDIFLQSGKIRVRVRRDES